MTQHQGEVEGIQSGEKRSKLSQGIWIWPWLFINSQCGLGKSLPLSGLVSKGRANKITLSSPQYRLAGHCPCAAEMVPGGWKDGRGDPGHDGQGGIWGLLRHLHPPLHKR